MVTDLISLRHSLQALQGVRFRRFQLPQHPSHHRHPLLVDVDDVDPRRLHHHHCHPQLQECAVDCVVIRMGLGHRHQIPLQFRRMAPIWLKQVHFEVVVFSGPGFAGVGFFFSVCSGADFFRLGAGPMVTGSPLALSGTWRLQGAQTSSAG